VGRIPGIVQEVHPSSEDWSRLEGDIQEEGSEELIGDGAVGMEGKEGTKRSWQR
jgi:hypothetical protein